MAQQGINVHSCLAVPADGEPLGLLARYAHPIGTGHRRVKLGGFLTRAGDREPGVKTLWRGLGKWHHLLAGSQLASKP